MLQFETPKKKVQLPTVFQLCKTVRRSLSGSPHRHGLPVAKCLLRLSFSVRDLSSSVVNHLASREGRRSRGDRGKRDPRGRRGCAVYVSVKNFFQQINIFRRARISNTYKYRKSLFKGEKMEPIAVDSNSFKHLA